MHWELGGDGIYVMKAEGVNQKGEMVLDYVRWVMVHKRDPNAAVQPTTVLKTAPSVKPEDLIVPEGLSLAGYDDGAAGFGGDQEPRAMFRCAVHPLGRGRHEAIQTRVLKFQRRAALGRLHIVGAADG